MKNFIFPLFLLVAACATAQNGNIRFTIKKSSTQANQVQIYGKNISASSLSGTMGSSALTLCISFPSMYTGGVPVISSPLPQQTFEPIIRSRFSADSIYSWNGAGGTTPSVTFAPNTEVLIATIDFKGSFATSTVKAVNVAGGTIGDNYFCYNYIALSGTEQSGYLIPFYSNISNDPLLVNSANTSNDPYSTTQTSSIGVSGVALPTKFLSFYASKLEDNAKLTWTVDNEEDNAYFEVEASTDARSFKMMQKVDALRNGRSSNTYTTSDNRISRYNTSIIYYRIKQVEASGKIVYSDVRQVAMDSKNFVAAIYPNPVKTITKLVVEAPEAGKATVIIRDAAGKSVKQMTLQLQKGTNQQELDASAFAAGDYNVTIMGDKLNQTIKMTKSN